MQNTSVVMVLRSLGSGGVEAHVRQLIFGLKNRNFKLTIVSLCDEGFDDRFSLLGVTIVQLADAMSQSIGSLRNISKLKAVLNTIQPDVVHLHGIRPIFIGTMAARLAGVPKIVCTMHGSLRLMAMKDGGSVAYSKLFVSKLMHTVGVLLSHEFIVVAELLKSELHDCLISILGKRLGKHYLGKVNVLSNAIDDCFFEANTEGLSSSDLVTIGTVARLDPKKGVQYLIEAFITLIGLHKNARLLIVGEGHYLGEYQLAVRSAGVEDLVTFAGHQTNVIPYLDNMDIFVLPSLSEGMPLVILEAMARGVPVISTNVGGVPEILCDGETGFLVQPEDTVSLSNAICVLLTDKELRNKFAKNAKEYVSANHRQAPMLDKLVELYEL